MAWQDTHPHLTFSQNWALDIKTERLLGECVSLIDSIKRLPLAPNRRKQLMRVSLVKGSDATTAIEGNTLSEDDVSAILAEESKVPKSQQYLEQEVKNVLNALNLLQREVLVDNKRRLISKEILLEFHHTIGQNLGEHFDAIPGRFRGDNRQVGEYRAPDYSYVDDLINRYCDWLKNEFRFEDNRNDNYLAIIQAIVAHVYFEWIHPFGDGNGRTGRLVEFYVLLRAGFQPVASHVLSNHYNQTRTAYYRELSKATRMRSLGSFINYAVQGLKDGLVGVLENIEEELWKVVWQNHVYEKFAQGTFAHKNVMKRQRTLILEMKAGEVYTIKSIPDISISVAKLYGSLSIQSIRRDIDALLNMELLSRVGRSKFTSNHQLLESRYSTI